MRLVRINEAEAIIEAFWTGDKNADGSIHAPLDEYRVEARPGAKLAQGGGLTIENAVPREVALVAECACDVDLREFDTVRLFAALPRGLQVNISGCMDGRSVALLCGIEGADNYDEFDAPLAGGYLTALRLEFVPLTTQPLFANLVWLGVANSARQAEMEARPSPYSADWPGLLEHGAATELKPHVGMFFNADELAALREKVASGPLRQVMDGLRAQATQDLGATPEADIGDTIAAATRRFSRNRDMRRPTTLGVMERLAFVGVIDGDLRMSRLAARMALSAAHCTHWDDSVVGHFPGSPWHHRSFTEAWMAFSCSLVLDWAGEALTPAGREVVRDALIMKALPRLESDFMRWEYIRSMNQGLMFSAGRILTLLALETVYPRYGTRLAEAERDLHEMLETYVQEDGGTREGMHYWSEILTMIAPPLYALARRSGQTLQEYAPAALRKNADYALSQFSTTGGGDTFLPINVMMHGHGTSPRQAAVYLQVSDRPEWKELYARAVHRNHLPPDIFHLLFAPPETPEISTEAVRPAFFAHFATGHAGAIRALPGGGFSHFHLCSGPGRGGHSHEDKGSFVLEAHGEALLIDRGVIDYADPRHKMMAYASAHNLLYPQEDGALLHQLPQTTDGGVLTVAREEGGQVWLASDNAGAWEAGLFRKNVRRIFSPSPELFVIEDEVELCRDVAVSFGLHTPFQVEAREGGWWIQGRAGAVRVTPLNWIPDAVEVEVAGIDSELKPVQVLRLGRAPASRHRLLTALEVVAAEARPRWEFSMENGGTARCGGRVVSLDMNF